MVWLILVQTIIAFVVTYMITPKIIRFLLNHKIVGRDLHKQEKRVCAEMGGLSVLLGFLITVPFIPSIIPLEKTLKVFMSIFTVLMTALIGIVDYFLRLRQRYKCFCLILASIPLIIVSLNETTITIPTIGPLYFGILYPLVLVPLGIVTAANLTNMLAGFNGLETGTGAVSLLTLTIAAIFLDKMEVVVLTAPLAASLIAFLRYNWFPARVFPGDLVTLMIGSAIAASAIIGRIEVIAMILLFPAAMDFTLKLFTLKPFAQRSVYGDTRVLPDGSLDPPPYPALVHAFMRISKVNEKEVVLDAILLEIIHCALAIIVLLLYY